MAFNPFHRFRKHQKVFFAILTIVCMITFIFSFGQGDLIHRVMAWFGASHSRGEVVTKLYGDKVYEGQLYDLAQRRKVADVLIQYWARNGMLKTIGDLSKQAKDLKSPLPITVRTAVDAFPQNFQFAMRFPGIGFVFQTNEKMLDELARDLRGAENTAASGKEEEAKESDEEQVHLLMQVITAYSYLAWLSEPLIPEAELAAGSAPSQQSRKELYLGGHANTDGLLDFLVWKHQADRLGIVLTDEGLRREIQREAAGQEVLPSKDLRASIENLMKEAQQKGDTQFLQLMGNLRPEDVITALKDEFRVALAKEALLGSGPGVRKFRNKALGINPSATTPTPEEFLEYYRDQRTTLSVEVLDIPVEHFMKQVKGEPSPDEVENLWDTYRDVEYDPASPTPGYKIPRRMQFQFAIGSPENSAYEKEAATLVPAYETLPYLFPALPATTALGGGFVPWATSLYTARLDPELRQRYHEYAIRVDTERFNFFNGKPGLLVDTPDQHVALAGQAVAALQNPLTPLMVPTALIGTQTLQRRAVAETAAASMLAPTVQLSPFSAALLPYPFYFSRMTYQQAEPLLRSQYQKTIAGKLFDKNLKTFTDELKKLSAKPAQAAKYVTEAARKYHFTLKETGELTAYQAEEDPTLKPLLESPDFVNQLNMQAPPEEVVLNLFGTRDRPQNRRYEPLEARGKNDNKILWWRTNVIAPTPLSQKAALPKIEETWRLNRARVLANAEADRINAELQKKERADRLRFLTDQVKAHEKAFRLEELKGVARLVKPKEVLARQESEYRPYTLPLKDREWMRYPPSDLVAKLMSLKKNGDAMVFADEPARHYYIAVLMARPTESVSTVRDHYQKNDALWKRNADQLERDFFRRIRKDLRAEAVGAQNLDSSGNYVINDTVRQRLNNSRDVGE